MLILLFCELPVYIPDCYLSPRSVFQNKYKYLLIYFCYYKWNCVIFAILFACLIAVDISVLILYFATLLNSLTVCNSLYIVSFGFFRYACISFVNGDSFLFYFPVCMALNTFSCLIMFSITSVQWLLTGVEILNVLSQLGKEESPKVSPFR